MYFFLSGENLKLIYIHLEQAFYLFRKTWKYGGIVFGTEVAGRAQTE